MKSILIVLILLMASNNSIASSDLPPCSSACGRCAAGGDPARRCEKDGAAMHCDDYCDLIEKDCAKLGAMGEGLPENLVSGARFDSLLEKCRKLNFESTGSGSSGGPAGAPPPDLDVQTGWPDYVFVSKWTNTEIEFTRFKDE